MVLVQRLMSQMLRSTATDNTPTEFWDLFCGIGGASTGAAMAGLTVKFACDASEGALKTHAHNHPGATHRCLQLPASDAQLMLPTDGRAFWIHGSPPCTQLSIIQSFALKSFTCVLQKNLAIKTTRFKPLTF